MAVSKSCAQREGRSAEQLSLFYGGSDAIVRLQTKISRTFLRTERKKREREREREGERNGEHKNKTKTGRTIKPRTVCRKMAAAAAAA